MERIRDAIAIELPIMVILAPLVWQTEMHWYVRSLFSLMKKKRASGSSSMRSSQEKWPPSWNCFKMVCSQESGLTPLRNNLRRKFD